VLGETHSAELERDRLRARAGARSRPPAPLSISRRYPPSLASRLPWTKGGAGSNLVALIIFFWSIASAREHSWLVPCLYDEEPQRALVRNLLQDVLEELKRRGPWDLVNDSVDANPRGGNLVAYMNRYAPILKHKSFEEERKWRIISRPLMCRLPRFDFRAGPSMLIPYYRIAVSADDCPFRVEEIIVGPTPHQSQSRRSVQSLLVRCELKNTRVRNTAGPYRSW
jgi:hypothetical protein